MFKLNFVLQAAAAGGNQMVFQLLFFGAFFAIIYFLMIRPQQKRQKEQISFETSLAKGQSVVTSSGIVGKVNSIDDDGKVTLEVGNKVFIQFLKTSISKELSEGAK